MTEQRPIQPTPVGALRFNTDSAKLEYFDGNQYVNITTDSPETNTGGTRGIWGGGYSGGGGGSGNSYSSGGGGSYTANLSNVSTVGYQGTGAIESPSGGFVKITFIG